MYTEVSTVLRRICLATTILGTLSVTVMADGLRPAVADAPLVTVADQPTEQAAEQATPAQLPTRATRTPAAMPQQSGSAPKVMPSYPPAATILSDPDDSAVDEGVADSKLVNEPSKTPMPAEASPPAEVAKPDETGEPSDAGEEPLVPVPDPLEAGPIEIEAASFNGVTPGQATLADVQKSWGAPKEMEKQNGVLMHLYAVEPFEHVEVSFIEDKVSSVVIRFENSFPANTVAQQLELTAIRPVFVSNALGEILGQVYPERGVSLAFEPADAPRKASMKVTQIVLEPIDAEPFVLRAETTLKKHTRLARLDLEQALKLQPNNAKAHWLLSRVLISMNKFETAATAAASAVRLQPSNSRYRVTLAQSLGQSGRIDEAIKEARQTAETCQKRPHVKAHALCLLGDLHASGAKPDYKQAIRFHMEAAAAAEALIENEHPAIRIAAKEVLVDANLGAAHDIAWGEWKEKDAAVTAWLEKASAAAEDLVANESASRRHRLHVATRALAACVGLQGKVDPEAWAEQALEAGDELIAATNDRERRAALQWDLGMALYDALQIYQMRNDQETAVKCGEVAIAYLEQGKAGVESPEADYLLGRLNFRLGAIHAIRGKDHATAVKWFDKALALLDKPQDKLVGDMGRHGETFVSMGVSYWQAGQRDKAVTITEKGVAVMEDAVAQGILGESSLSVPYGNLASMHRQMGSPEKAQRFQELANRRTGETLR